MSALLGRPSLRIIDADFQRVLDGVHAGAFVYCDPPYAPLSGTSKFTAYTAGGFSDADQARLQRCVLSLARQGCSVVVSNSATPLITRLYADDAEAQAAGLSVHLAAARRSINANAVARGKIAECVITNVPFRAQCGAATSHHSPSPRRGSSVGGADMR